MGNLLLYFLAILILVFAVFFGMIFYKKNRKEAFTIFNHFPCELKLSNSLNYLDYLILLSIIILIILAGNLFLINPSNHVNYFLSNIIGFLLIILDILLFSIFQFKFEKSFKTHISLVSIFSSLILALNIFGIMFIFRSDSFSRLFIIPFAIFIIIEILLLILIFVKGIENNVKVEENNEIIYKRKKIITLAILEWGSIIILCLTTLVFILILL